MPREHYGELVPVGGGDPIPMIRDRLTVGRRESCDICLKFQNVSSTHCEFLLQNGFWVLRDLGSTNGVKINGEKLLTRGQRALRPGDEVSIASHRYTIQYTPAAGAELDAALAQEEDIFSRSLMEKAGLEKPKTPRRDTRMD